MAYNEKLAGRVRKLLVGRKGFDEKKMFGGLCFLLDGKMVCGVLKEDLVLRIGPEKYQAALTRPHVRSMDFTGRPIKGFIFVGPGGCRTEKSPGGWVKEAMEHVTSVPQDLGGKRKSKKS